MHLVQQGKKKQEFVFRRGPQEEARGWRGRSPLQVRGDPPVFSVVTRRSTAITGEAAQ